jgi:hypothetical protein
MAHAEQISTLRRRRSALISRMAVTRRNLDDYEEKGRADEDYLISCQQSVAENWAKIIAAHDDLVTLDEEESERLIPASDEHH